MQSVLQLCVFLLYALSHARRTQTSSHAEQDPIVARVFVDFLNAITPTSAFATTALARHIQKGKAVRSTKVIAALENPYDTGTYFAPKMGKAEQEALTVPYSEVGEKLRGMLDKHGVAIVTGVIPDDELSGLENNFKEDLIDLIDTEALKDATPAAQEAYNNFLREGPKAFPAKTAKQFSIAAGFSIARCLSHGKFAWSVRQHPNVQAVYKALYPDAEQLVTSVDVPFFTPGDVDSAESNPFSAHVDQNIHDERPGLAEWESYQGVVYVWPSDEDSESSTTVVWPESHRKVYPELMKDLSWAETGLNGYHYSEIRMMSDPDVARKFAAGWAEHARRSVIPRGAMLLWNSRTVHTGWRGGPRLAQCVCFEPATRRAEAERVAKLRLAALGLPSAHWASAGMQHDMIIGDGGYFNPKGIRAETGDEDGVDLPLHSAIRPVGLATDADLNALKELVTIPYQFTGMWDPDEESAELLEASVVDKVKSLL